MCLIHFTGVTCGYFDHATGSRLQTTLIEDMLWDSVVPVAAY